MKRSTDRILTTHTGSLPRPADLISMLQAKETGQPYDRRPLATGADGGCRGRAESGGGLTVDIVSDGEMGKPGFFHYVRSRLRGLEGLTLRPARPRTPTSPAT